MPSDVSFFWGLQKREHREPLRHRTLPCTLRSTPQRKEETARRGYPSPACYRVAPHVKTHKETAHWGRDLALLSFTHFPTMEVELQRPSQGEFSFSKSLPSASIGQLSCLNDWALEWLDESQNRRACKIDFPFGVPFDPPTSRAPSRTGTPMFFSALSPKGPCGVNDLRCNGRSGT